MKIVCNSDLVWKFAGEMGDRIKSAKTPKNFRPPHSVVNIKQPLYDIMSKTRKRVRKTPIYLVLMYKQRGGRNTTNATFKTICNPRDASAKLIGLHSIKTPEEGDDYIHVVKSTFQNKELVVKMQEPGRMVSMELNIHNKIKLCNNVIKYICDFECLFDNLIWNNPLETPQYFCNNDGEPMHIIVMEYINNDVAEFLSSEVYDDAILSSIVKQAGLALLDFHINHGVCHNGINRGNILLKIDPNNSRHLTYTIKDNIAHINTHGHEVVYIDFQRGSLIDERNNANNVLQQAIDEISLLYELMSKWAKPHKVLLKTLMNSVINAESLNELFHIICNYSP